MNNKLAKNLDILMEAAIQQNIRVLNECAQVDGIEKFYPLIEAADAIGEAKEGLKNEPKDPEKAISFWEKVKKKLEALGTWALKVDPDKKGLAVTGMMSLIMMIATCTASSITAYTAIDKGVQTVAAASRVNNAAYQAMAAKKFAEHGIAVASGKDAMKIVTASGALSTIKFVCLTIAIEVLWNLLVKLVDKEFTKINLKDIDERLDKFKKTYEDLKTKVDTAENLKDKKKIQSDLKRYAQCIDTLENLKKVEARRKDREGSGKTTVNESVDACDDVYMPMNESLEDSINWAFMNAIAGYDYNLSEAVIGTDEFLPLIEAADAIGAAESIKEDMVNADKTEKMKAGFWMKIKAKAEKLKVWALKVDPKKRGVAVTLTIYMLSITMNFFISTALKYGGTYTAITGIKDGSAAKDLKAYATEHGKDDVLKLADEADKTANSKTFKGLISVVIGIFLDVITLLVSNKLNRGLLAVNLPHIDENIKDMKTELEKIMNAINEATQKKDKRALKDLTAMAVKYKKCIATLENIKRQYEENKPDDDVAKPENKETKTEEVKPK